jgi:hypothetical protein
MGRSGVQSETLAPEEFIPGALELAVDERTSWFARLVTLLIPQEAVFADLRFDETDVQHDLKYGCD